MLNVDYTRKMGEVVITQEQDGQPIDFKTNIYWCNGLAAFIYEYDDKNGDHIYQLMNFFADKQHVKNLIKSKTELFLGKVKSVSLNMLYKDNEYVLDYFLKMGHKVECYYQEPPQTERK